MSLKEKILVELSGGVDSAVTALILKEKNYDVYGAMMHVYDNETFKEDLVSAEQICKKLNIPFKLIDLRKQFNEYVIKYFIDTYIKSETPNPCILCNKKMKFGVMFNIMKDLKCDKIATGHYARITYNNNHYELHRAIDNNKDQSYVLFFLNQETLNKLLFPLGDYEKKDIRKIAAEANFTCSSKSDSQDICFIKNNNYAEFILNNTRYKLKPGNVINSKGEYLGQHNGLINYTIGQRKGLGLAFDQPMYVTKLDSKNNQLTLGTHEETMQKHVYVKDFSWVDANSIQNKFKCSAKLRYRQNPQNCDVEVSRDNVILYYKNKISAVTPGQFAVLYDNDKVLGGGTIIDKK